MEHAGNSGTSSSASAASSASDSLASNSSSTTTAQRSALFCPYDPLLLSRHLVASPHHDNAHPAASQRVYEPPSSAAVPRFLSAVYPQAPEPLYPDHQDYLNTRPAFLSFNPAQPHSGQHDSFRSDASDVSNDFSRSSSTDYETDLSEDLTEETEGEEEEDSENSDADSVTASEEATRDDDILEDPSLPNNGPMIIRRLSDLSDSVGRIYLPSDPHSSSSPLSIDLTSPSLPTPPTSAPMPLSSHPQSRKRSADAMSSSSVENTGPAPKRRRQNDGQALPTSSSSPAIQPSSSTSARPSGIRNTIASMAARRYVLPPSPTDQPQRQQNDNSEIEILDLCASDDEENTQQTARGTSHPPSLATRTAASSRRRGGGHQAVQSSSSQSSATTSSSTIPIPPQEVIEIDLSSSSPPNVPTRSNPPPTAPGTAPTTSPSRPTQPTFKPTQNSHVKKTKLNTITCSICIEPATDLVGTACGHTFCRACLLDWLISSEHEAGKKPTCPACRKPLNKVETKTRKDVVPLGFMTREEFNRQKMGRLGGVGGSNNGGGGGGGITKSGSNGNGNGSRPGSRSGGGGGGGAISGGNGEETGGTGTGGTARRRTEVH